MKDLREQVQAALGGTYTIERELGGGGMSRVFVADETRLGRRVVIKVLSPELAAGISADRFEREIRMAASLQQANIVPVLSTGEVAGLPYYTMPFVEGESLRQRLSELPPLSVSETIRIIGDVARALQYAHSHAIVHRDIKPDNVLLSGGTAVVTDFGIAKALSASRTRGEGETLTQLGTSIGTPAYMSPEQAAGDPDVDHRSDIYALGCMAFELVSGKPPFHGRTPARTLGAHMGEAPPPLAELRPDLPAALCDVIMRCLEKNPDARPQHATEIVEALNGVTSGGGMPALPPVLMYAPGAFRRAILFYVVAVVGVAAVAKAATMTIGLPEWVFPGALLVMALGLPVILFTGYVQSVTRRALLSTPAITPGGGQVPHGTMATIALKASPHVSWKRTTRGGLMALGAFVFLIVGFMVMRAFGIGPAASLFASGRLNQRDLILVSDFGVNHADSSVGSVVAEGVRANLGESRSVTLFNPARVAGVLKLMQVAPTTKLDLKLAMDVAQREGVKAIVTGDVTGIGSGFVIALRIVSPDSGTVLASYQTTVDGPSGLVNGIDEVTRKLRGKIGESLRSVQASPPLAQVTTSSYEALKAYTEGAHAFDAEHDFTKAIPLLRRAVQIDTGFATAWRKLGTAMVNIGYPTSVSDSVVTKAFQLRNRLTEGERYLAEGYYYGRGPGHDRTRAVAAYQSLIARGDTNYGANNLGVFYAASRELVKAESLYRMAYHVNADNMIPVPNLVYMLINQGKRAAVDTFMAIEAKKIAGSPSYLYQMVVLAHSDGKYDQAQQILDSARAAAKTPQLKGMVNYLSSTLAAVRGRISEADRLYRERMVNQAAIGNASPPIVDSMNLALADAWFRKAPARAAGRLDAAIAAHPLSSIAEQDRPYTDLARVYAVAEQPARARAMLAQFATIRDTAFYRSRQPAVHLALGEIAIAEHRFADAIPEFRKADVGADGLPVDEDPLSVHFNLGRAFDLANKPDSAIAEFETFLSTRYYGRNDVDMYALAGVHKRLGELYEARGDAERAISHFTAFIALWKNADPELQPAVADAKRRLARLQAGRRNS